LNVHISVKDGTVVLQFSKEGAAEKPAPKNIASMLAGDST